MLRFSSQPSVVRQPWFGAQGWLAVAVAWYVGTGGLIPTMARSVVENLARSEMVVMYLTSRGAWVELRTSCTRRLINERR